MNFLLNQRLCCDGLEIIIHNANSTQNSGHISFNSLRTSTPLHSLKCSVFWMMYLSNQSSIGGSTHANKFLLIKSLSRKKTTKTFNLSDFTFKAYHWELTRNYEKKLLLLCYQQKKSWRKGFLFHKRKEESSFCTETVWKFYTRQLLNKRTIKTFVNICFHGFLYACEFRIQSTQHIYIHTWKGSLFLYTN